MRAAAAVTLLATLSVSSGHAQQAPPPRAPNAVAADVTVVLVDVVVRDRRGEPVRDLTQSDFQIIEDGVPQSIGAFTPTFQGTARADATTAAAQPADPDMKAPTGATAPAQTGPAVTALVFDRLSPEARRLAVEAAQAYLGADRDAPNYIGIFGIDIGLTPYAPFTRNARVLRDALTQVGSRASASFNAPEMKQQRGNADRRASMAADQAASGAAAGGPTASAAMGTAAGEALLARMESRMLQEFDVMERDQQGYSTTNGLFAIIGALRPLPGRKSLVLFSEGVSIPPAVQRLFLGVIDAANRANVSIYAMDAAGLRAESDLAKIRDEVNEAGKRGINSAYANASGDAPLSKALEANEDALRRDPAAGLGELARSTGGLFFDNTNDLLKGFGRIDSDLQNYYLIGYTPANARYDGRFRTIEVKVNRPGVTVAARKGYFAVRNTGSAPVNPWEALPLGALEQRPVPNAFPIRAAGLLFPERNRPGLVPVIVNFSTAPLTFQSTPDGKAYSSNFAVVVRFLDAYNQVVRKVSQHYEVNGPFAELERAKGGEVIFYREPELPPGVYTMETVVYDAPSARASVRFSTVEVPKVDATRLGMSSLVLVKRGDQVPEADRRADNPLIVKDVVLQPNLGDPVSKSKEVGFYFAVYPARGHPAPGAAIEILQNGVPLAKLPITLPAADAAGRIQQVGRLPLDGLAAGTYELRAIVTQGKDHLLRSTMLQVVE